jgi:hypothetical protein
LKGQYAKKTKINANKTKLDIETVLIKYGVTEGFSYTRNGNTNYIAFKHQGRSISFSFKLPDLKNREYTHTTKYDVKRSPEKAYESWEQDCRAYWRALYLFIKATLEAIEIGIIEFDQAFLPYFLTKEGKTISEIIMPKFPQLVSSTDEVNK